MVAGVGGLCGVGIVVLLKVCLVRSSVDEDGLWSLRFLGADSRVLTSAAAAAMVCFWVVLDFEFGLGLGLGFLFLVGTC